jgi:hypothetical protein
LGRLVAWLGLGLGRLVAWLGSRLGLERLVAGL